MDLPVRDHHDAGAALRRDIAVSLLNRAEKPGFLRQGISFWRSDNSYFQALLIGVARLERVKSFGCAGGAFAKALAIALIDYDQRHVGDGIALLLQQRGPQQGYKQPAQGQCPEYGQAPRHP